MTGAEIAYRFATIVARIAGTVAGFASNDYLAVIPFSGNSLFLGFDFGQPSLTTYNGGQVTDAVLPIVDGSYFLSATLTPVPQPGPLALLGTGLFALGLVARRRRA